MSSSTPASDASGLSPVRKANGATPAKTPSASRSDSGESDSQGAGPLFWACCNCKSQDHYISSGHPTAGVPPLGGWASSPGGKGNVLVAMPNRTLRHIELVRARINFSSTHTHCNFVWPNKSIAYGGRGRYFLRANPNVSVDPASPS